MRLGLGLGSSAVNKHNSEGEDDMPMRYLFIDGGFYRGFIEDMKQLAMTDHGELHIDLNAVRGGYDRVFFYDAYPVKKDGQSQEEFDAEFAKVEDYFREISRTAYFNVRPALTRRGRRQQQKGVDVLLAIECLMHAVRNNIDEATIMTSDLDFFPLLEALLQTKTKSTLMYEIGRASDDLVQAADHARPLTFVDFENWLKPACRIVKQHYNVKDSKPADNRTVASGSIAGKPYNLMRSVNPEGYFSVLDGEVFSNITRCRAYTEAQIEASLTSKIIYTSEQEE